MASVERDEEIPLLERNNKPEMKPADYQTLTTTVVNFAESSVTSFSSQKYVYFWDQLNVYGKSNSKWFSKCTRQMTRNSSNEFRKHILRNVFGMAYPGEILAILGPSGGGKTTLLNALTFRTDSTGFRYLNGRPLRNPKALARLSAYIEQNTLFLNNLSVKEHLTFQAMIRMNNELSRQEKERRVMDVILQLGLEKCENVTIGSLVQKKGISGGEMKRLAFATEILTDPPMLFCDEPTSGLDSFSALNLIRILKGMAAKEKTIVCTVHQPSSEMLSHFDKILILSEGKVAYLGSCRMATEFLKDLNVIPHHHLNLLDIFIGLVSVVPNREDSSRENINFLCDFFEESIYGQEIKNKLESIRNRSPNAYSKEFDWLSTMNSGENLSNTNWLIQFKALCWRSWLTTLKEPLLVKVRVFQMVVLSLAVGLIYQHQNKNDDGIFNINGVLFTFLTNMTFQNMFAVINVFCSELPIFLKENGKGLYGTGVYFLSKTLSEIPVFMLIPSVFTGITYFWIGLNPGLHNFFSCILIMILVTNTTTSFGYFVSCVSTNLLMALSIGSPIVIPFLLFGGYLLSVGSIPPYFEWLSYLSWFNYGNEALMINQWASVKKIDCIPSQPTCPTSGAVILESYYFKEKNYLRDLISLGILILIFRFMAFLALFIKTMRYRKSF